MAERLRDTESVRRLFRKLRRNIHDDHGVDIGGWNVAWKRLACERLATYGPSSEHAIAAAEGDLIVAMGLVYMRGLYFSSRQQGAPPSAFPSLVNADLIDRWHDYAREHSQHHPDIDPFTWDMLTKIGYAFLRKEDE